MSTDSDTESVDSGHSLNSAEGWSEVSGQDDDIELPVVASIPLVRPSIRSQRVGFEQTDDWNLQEVFRTRASVMRTVTRFLWASFRAALKIALEEILAGQQNRQTHRQERGWKLFLALPRMLLHRPPRGGLISKEKLMQRFDKFVSGQWTELLRASCECAEEAATASRRRRRRGTNQDLESRASRALRFVQQGELSSGRQALEGAELALGNGVTLAALRRRHAVLQNPIPALPPDGPIFYLDESLFSKNVRSARRGVAGGPSRMTSDHLRPLLEHPKDLHFLFQVAEGFSRGVVPDSTVQIL